MSAKVHNTIMQIHVLVVTEVKSLLVTKLLKCNRTKCDMTNGFTGHYCKYRMIKKDRLNFVRLLLINGVHLFESLCISLTIEGHSYQ